MCVQGNRIQYRPATPMAQRPPSLLFIPDFPISVPGVPYYIMDKIFAVRKAVIRL